MFENHELQIPDWAFHELGKLWCWAGGWKSYGHYDPKIMICIFILSKSNTWSRKLVNSQFSYQSKAHISFIFKSSQNIFFLLQHSKHPNEQFYSSLKFNIINRVWEQPTHSFPSFNGCYYYPSIPPPPPPHYKLLQFWSLIYLKLSWGTGQIYLLFTCGQFLWTVEKKIPSNPNHPLSSE